MKKRCRCWGDWEERGGDDKAVSVLNRAVEWREEGITMEPDQRHVDLIIEQLGLGGA